MRFNDLFPDAIEYGDPTKIDVTQSGWRLDYISSTFLNGWINYVKPFRVYVVSKYSQGDEFEATKAKVAAWIAKPPFHTNLGELGDDVVMLAKDAAGRLWYFWFDCDVSDCSIGVPDVSGFGGLSEEDVVDLFDEDAIDTAGSYGGVSEALLIPNECVRGWVKF